MHAQPTTMSLRTPRTRSSAASALLVIGGWMGAFAILAIAALLLLAGAAVVFGSALMSQV
jgi:hypothetical protein